MNEKSGSSLMLFIHKHLCFIKWLTTKVKLSLTWFLIMVMIYGLNDTLVLGTTFLNCCVRWEPEHLKCVKDDDYRPSICKLLLVLLL